MYCKLLKGIQVLGTTYQRDPYEVFEDGIGRQGFSR